MANRYPIIVDTTDGNKLKEIPSGDNLQLTGNGIIGVTDVTASGTIAANVLSATSIKKGGTEIATVAITGSYNDLSNRPTQLSDLIDDMNVLVPGDNVGQLTNNVGYLTSVSFSQLTSKPTTLAGYGITDAATSAQGALASSAIQPGANITSLLNNAGYVTLEEISSGLISIDVNNTGDLVGSVFADDSTVMIDSILAAVNLDGTIRGNVIPVADAAYDLGSATNQFKDLHLSGTIQTGFIGTTYLDGKSGTDNLYISAGTLITEVGNSANLNSTFIVRTQKAAFIGTVVPSSSIGAEGDVAGQVSFDGTYMYYCTAPYDSITNIWKRVAWSVDTWQ